MSKLTPKQEKFCNLYVELGNASEAYRRSYSCKRMKDETINNKAYQLLQRGDIRARVKELQAELKAKSDYKKEDALKSLVDIANANVADFIQIAEDETTEVENGGKTINKSTTQVILIKSLDELTPEQQKCIKSIQPTRGGGLRLELYSRLDAIDRIAKMCGWDEATKHKVEAEVTSRPIDINQAREIVDTIINE